MIHVTLYSRPGCHLCEIVEQLLHHVRIKHPFHLEICDIDQNPADFQNYKNDIPVVVVNGKEAGRHHLTAKAFEAALIAAETAK
jgi:glutaredoxin